MDPEIAKIYGNQVRVRVCGLCWVENKLLLVNHKSLTSADFWSPPGGGLEFGEALHECLKREFLEETGYSINVGDFVLGCEFVKPPLHAVELFFEAFFVSGVLKTGHDPELDIVQDVKLLSEAQIDTIPHDQLHGIFRKAKNAGDFKKLRGFYRI